MNQLTRRNFLKALAGLPALAWLKPETPEAEAVEIELVPTDERVYITDEMVYISLAPPGKQIRWNGAGDSWESVDGGKTWMQTGFRPTLEVKPDGGLCVSGNFLEETPEEVRRRHLDYFSQF